MLTAFVVILALTSAVNTPVPPAEPEPLETAQCIHPHLPQPVCELFYAIKESLDYGMGTKHRPFKKLTDYPRVTKELLERVNQEFRVTLYQPVGDDYQLIVTSRSNSEERYRATRMVKCWWHDDHWVSLGGYLYF